MKNVSGDFPGGPVVKASPSSGGYRFSPWLGNRDPTWLVAEEPKQKTCDIVTNSTKTLKY